MKKWIVKGTLLAIVAVIMVPILINELYQADNGYFTVWTGADVLSFYGAALGAIGTIALGMVAWGQNKRLLKIEENNFLSNNLSRLLISGLQISDFNKIACNFDLHTEQMVTSDMNNYDCSKCRSFTLTFTIDTIENYQALLKVERIILRVQEKNSNNLKEMLVVDAEEIFEEYSSIAMAKDGFVFNCTCIVPIATFEILQSKLKKECAIVTIVDLKTVTVKWICTRWRLKAKMLYHDKSTGELFNFSVETTTPATCFWLDTKVVNKEEVKIRRVDEIESAERDEKVNLGGQWANKFRVVQKLNQLKNSLFKN